MGHDEILEKVNDIFITVLDTGAIALKDETTANDVEEWDSLTHIQLVVAIEKHFRIRFASNEIQRWRNVGEMIASIESKTHRF